MLLDPKQPTIHRLHALKRELLAIRRAVWPLRDLLSSLVRDDLERFTDETRVYLRDVHDHAVQVLDTVEALRDVVSGMVDLYLSTVSFRTNEVMKVLTIMASIFIPLTFFAGVYGMNFEYMPELHMQLGVPHAPRRHARPRPSGWWSTSSGRGGCRELPASRRGEVDTPRCTPPQSITPPSLGRAAEVLPGGRP